MRIYIYTDKYVETGTDKIKYAKMIKVLKVSKQRYRRLKKKKRDYYKRNRPRKISRYVANEMKTGIFVRATFDLKKEKEKKNTHLKIKILGKLFNFMQNFNFSLFFLFRFSIRY